MKTKLVQHVESEWMRDWKSVRVRKSESEREWEWESVRVSFEHRHENKSCSEHSNIDTFQVPSFCLTFRHFWIANTFEHGFLLLSNWKHLKFHGFLLCCQIMSRITPFFGPILCRESACFGWHILTLKKVVGDTKKLIWGLAQGRIFRHEFGKIPGGRAMIVAEGA